MHRELWIRSRIDLAIVLSVRRFVKCFVMYFDLRLVFPRLDLFRKADPSESLRFVKRFVVYCDLRLVLP